MEWGWRHGDSELEQLRSWEQPHHNTTHIPTQPPTQLTPQHSPQHNSLTSQHSPKYTSQHNPQLTAQDNTMHNITHNPAQPTPGIVHTIMGKQVKTRRICKHLTMGSSWTMAAEWQREGCMVPISFCARIRLLCTNFGWLSPSTFWVCFLILLTGLWAAWGIPCLVV